MNGEEHVGRAEFDKHVSANDREIGNINEELGSIHGLFANFLMEQRSLNAAFKDELRRELSQLRVDLGGEVRKTQESFHELEEVTARSKVESLHRQLAEARTADMVRKDWIRWGVRYGLTLIGGGGGGAVVWENVIKPLLHR